MKTKYTLACIWLTALLGAGCATTEGNSQIETETRTVSSFSKVDSNDGVETILTIDPAQSGDVTLEVTAESNLLSSVNTNVSNDLLGVGVNGSVQSNVPITVIGIVNDISEAQAHNGSMLVVEDIDRDTLIVGAVDGAMLTASGEVTSVSVGGSGGASLLCAELVAIDAQVGLSDGATAVVCASGAVTGSVTNGAVLTVQCGGDTSGVTTSDGGTVN